VLDEPGKRFSRLEAWLYIVNILASGIDDEKSGRKRGELCTSSRYLALKWNWPRTTVQRFFTDLEAAGMIVRINTDLGHFVDQSAGRQEGHFNIQKYETYNPVRADEWATSRANINKVFKESINKIKDTRAPAEAGACVSPKILPELYKQHNQLLPEVKALSAERLRKCRSRINQAVRDGCLEQYLADFEAAVKKAQQTPFLRGEGARGWRASFDWFVANQVNVYKVLEGKYDGPSAGPNHGGENVGRTSSGDPIYIPRQ
jgi:DNA-binding transcriptional regulator YhcF (GntR family)